jgi:uncharacterized protein (TIGR02271 family)
MPMSRRPPSQNGAGEDAHTHTVPVAREEAEILRREVEKARVEVSTHVREREEIVEQDLRHDEVDIERVTVNREVDGPLDTRQDGDCMVIPVVEEVLVVQKRWMLKEEIRIRRRSVASPHRERVRLRSEEVSVERKAAPENDR